RYLAERGGDRAERTQPVGATDDDVDRGGHPARIRRFDPQYLEPPVAAAAFRERGVELAFVQPRTLPSLGPPLLRRTKVVDECELHVRHRLAACDGDRQSVVGDPSLGV